MSASPAELTAPPAAARASRRSPGIDGIRGWASIALLTVHVGMLSGLLGTRAFGDYRPPTNFVGAFFVSGMSIFIAPLFILPAMFLYLPLAKAVIAGTKRPSQGKAFSRRLLRLLPAYYVLYLVTLLTLNRGEIHDVWFVLRPILLLHIYLPSPFVPRFVNGMEITWTVPTMVQWYAALPLIAWATHKFAARGSTPASRARRLMLPVPVLFAVGVAWLIFVKSQGWDNRIVFWWPQGFAPEFAIGMALAIMLALAQVSPTDMPKLFRLAAARPNVFWIGAVLIYVVNCVRPASTIGLDSWYSISGLLLTYLLVALFGLTVAVPLIVRYADPGARGDNKVVKAALASKPAAYLGRIGYGIYLWHFAVMHFYLQPGNIFSTHVKSIPELYGQSRFWPLEIVALAGSVIMASLSYYLVERPVMALGERYLLSRRRRPTAIAELQGWPPGTELAAAAMTHEQAAAAVAVAATDRDAIQANLLDLDGCFGRQLLSGANVVGQTRKRWTAVSADLATLWELFAVYSAVVDRAAGLLASIRRSSGRELLEITNLLTGPSVLFVRAPAPIGQRDITDNGRLTLSVDAAVEELRRLFTSVAGTVAAAEEVWNEVTEQLEAISAELSEARRQADGCADAALTEALAAAETELACQRSALGADPLSLCPHGQLGTAALDRLRTQATAACSRARELALQRDAAAAQA